MPRYASVDIGSNSTLLLIVESTPGCDLKVLVDTKASTKLSSGVGSAGVMTQGAIDRQFRALDAFASIVAEQRVEQVAVCATQVFRVAKNGRNLAFQIEGRYGWRVEIIDGDREAELSYLAAATGLANVPDKRVVIDVGGGSSEIVYGISDEVRFSQSFPIGAVALAEKCGLTDVVDSAGKARARKEIESIFGKGDILQTRRGVFTICVGGTAATLAALHLGTTIFDPEKIHGVELTREWLVEKIDNLAGHSAEERRRILAFDPDRAEIIVAGAMIIDYLMEVQGYTRITVSNRGLRWGLIYDKFFAN